ncbi:hypothetical protein KY345_06925 [Candidatus Woesearchaeota archaeon]|nr:hypothetical protein [Candidatus Woesearchaeota archaeon]
MYVPQTEKEKEWGKQLEEDARRRIIREEREEQILKEGIEEIKDNLAALKRNLGENYSKRPIDFIYALGKKGAKEEAGKVVSRLSAVLGVLREISNNIINRSKTLRQSDKRTSSNMADDVIHKIGEYLDYWKHIYEKGKIKKHKNFDQDPISQRINHIFLLVDRLEKIMMKKEERAVKIEIEDYKEKQMRILKDIEQIFLKISEEIRDKVPLAIRKHSDELFMNTNRSMLLGLINVITTVRVECYKVAAKVAQHRELVNDLQDVIRGLDYYKEELKSTEPGKMITSQQIAFDEYRRIVYPAYLKVLQDIRAIKESEKKVEEVSFK